MLKALALELLDAAEVEISTTAGVHRVKLGELRRDTSPPGPAVRLLRPQVRVLVAGEEVARSTGAAGAPEGAWWNGLVLPAAAGGVALLLLGAFAAGAALNR